MTRKPFDALGTEIKVGDVIAYAVRDGNSAAMRVAIVKEYKEEDAGWGEREIHLTARTAWPCGAVGEIEVSSKDSVLMDCDRAIVLLEHANSTLGDKLRAAAGVG